MLNFKKVFVCIFVFLLLISSAVLADEEPVDVIVTSASPSETVSDNSQNISSAASTINSDLYITNTDYYTLSDIIYGNVYASVKNKFSTNSRNNGGIINGNLFLVSNETVIASDVSYSKNVDKNGNYLIDTINSKSIINGNVYAISNSFTIEAGSEIYGDLYLVTKNLKVEPNAIIHGNLFTTASDINFSGEIEGSAYFTTDNITMTYYSYIGRDLFLNTQNVTLDGVVCRNAHITANDISTKKNFKVMKDLFVNYAESLTLSGNFNNNVSLNVKNLNFKNDNEDKLIISGNLTYASKNNVEVPEGTVFGKVTKTDFVNNSSYKIDIGYYTIAFVALLVFVFAIIFLCKKFTPKALEVLPKLDTSNVLKSLLIGIASLFALVIIFVLLCLCGVGLLFGLFLVVAYLFMAFLSLPLFINKIAEQINIKLNIYVKLLMVVAALFLIKQIPFIGSLISSLIILTGIGDILVTVFKKK